MGAPGQELEEKIGYPFSNRQLLERALTHRSWISEQTGQKRDGGDNEQLEFLGDSVLGLVVGELLLAANPEMSEGELSRMKARLVCASHLHTSAEQLGLGEFMRLGRGEERNGGRQRKTVLANAMEALIAAIYLDGGLEPAKAFIRRQVAPSIESAADVASLSSFDYKGVLQEEAQSRGFPLPRYTIVATSGPEHSKRFIVEARIGTQFVSRGEGSSKKAGSQRAAQLLMQELSSTNWTPVPETSGSSESQP
jgi:ribonuclease III